MYKLPFDGIVVKSIVNELSELLENGRVEKIFQPEADEIILNLRSRGQNLKLLLSASPNFPRVHLTEVSKENPATPPVFCMLLRKHLSGGKITGIEFHDFERIITFYIESVNELGDLTAKSLIIEIMGRHSNIILVNNEGRILDAIKHVDNEVSRIREVMPGRTYVLPPAQQKTSPESLDLDIFLSADTIAATEISVEKYLLNNIKGFSPLICREICNISDIDEKSYICSLQPERIASLKSTLRKFIDMIINNEFRPCIIFENDSFLRPIDFHCLSMNQYKYIKSFETTNSTLETFYMEKDKAERTKQKKSDVLKLLNTNIDRCNKKLSIQQEKLRDVADRDKLKLFGELITANIYCIPKNAKQVSLQNYYSEDNQEIEIALDETISPQENAQRYFKQYQKAKSTYSYTSKQVEETLSELDYLDGVLQLLENCITLQEINEVRQELSDQGYLSSRKKRAASKNNKASSPLHFHSSTGFDIFVGKNNKQNDNLTMKQAGPYDMWLHTRNIPGSHVIIRSNQKTITDETIKEAAVLAAYHSKAKHSANVPVDYTFAKNVKKPPSSKPGMVIYDNFKTILVTPDENLVKSLSLKTGSNV